MCLILVFGKTGEQKNNASEEEYEDDEEEEQNDDYSPMTKQKIKKIEDGDVSLSSRP